MSCSRPIVVDSDRRFFGGGLFVGRRAVVYVCVF